jgi:hypothetical protein
VCAGGSELESGFAFGVMRQLFERAVAEVGRDALAGPAQAAALLGAATSRRAQLRATPSSPSSTGCTSERALGSCTLRSSKAIGRLP